MVWSGSNRGVGDMTATVDNELAGLRRAYAELEQRLNECCAERDEALQREAAIAEVLEVINSSPGDLAPVFDVMLKKALHLCSAFSGLMWTFDGDRAFVRRSEEHTSEL